ncbi:hypothetical protein ACC782_08825 [Rhizobium ruizarguesonis]
MSTSSMRSLVRNQGPIVLFVLLTIIGSAVIWLGKVWGFDIALITAIPVAMMFLYMIVNMLAGLRVHSEQAGDNLYYMGFIYTLTSLGVSLYRFTGEASIEDVVRNFGIAIISTVTGIALRIFFNQMRRDPADIEKAVRHELAEMTRRVRSELDNSAMEFSSYRRTSNQMLSEGFEEIARQAEKNGEAVRGSYRGNVREGGGIPSDNLKATPDHLRGEPQECGPSFGNERQERYSAVPPNGRLGDHDDQQVEAAL